MTDHLCFAYYYIGRRREDKNKSGQITGWHGGKRRSPCHQCLIEPADEFGYHRGMIARTLALFLGLFTLLNVVGQWRHDGFDINLWWIDLRALPSWLANLILCTAAGFMIAWASRKATDCAPWRRKTNALLVGGLMLVAFGNAIHVWVMLARGEVSSRFPLPLSLFIALALAGVLRAMLAKRRRNERGDSAENRSDRRRKRWWSLAKVATLMSLWMFVFAVLQMLCFGKTDYRRDADAILVFGAGVYADGRPSDALVDRVRTGCELYKQYPKAKLIFSGGPGQGAVHETQAMRALAVEWGVPPEAILLDAQGVNTQATVDNALAIMHEHGMKSLLAVSHFYHLPRVKMCFARAGQEVHTVPAKESYLLSWMPYYMAREVAALWSYYLRPLVAQ